MLGAEKVAASASESGQPHLLPTTGTPVYRLLISLNRIDLPGTDHDFGLCGGLKINGSRCSLQHRRGIYTGGGDGRVETFLTHVVGRWIRCNAAVVRAERRGCGGGGRQGFEDLELRLFLLRSLRHLMFISPPPASFTSRI